MKYLSTSALAKERELDSKELFNKLKEKGWIYKKEDKWLLTKDGRVAGGDTKYNPKFGDYVIWPFNLNIELFSFHKTTNSLSIHNKEKVKNGEFLISNLVGAIPELTATSLLSTSYQFSLPQGISGQIMQIGSGQGTALMQNGRIVTHGSYISNALVAVPFAVYSIGAVLIRQHYLNKIHKKLEAIESGLDTLLKFVFTDKRSKIDSIIYFYKKSFNEFDNVNTNLNYRNAILTNLIAKNIEVYELIQFYANSIHMTKNYDTDTKKYDFENNVKTFLELQDLFLYGKILSFMYSNLFDKELNEDLIKEFEYVSNLYMDVLSENSIQINAILVENNPRMNDWLLNRKQRKEDVRGQTIQDLLTINSVKREVIDNFENGQSIINNLIIQIEKPQDFIIEKGELYQLV